MSKRNFNRTVAWDNNYSRAARSDSWRQAVDPIKGKKNKRKKKKKYRYQICAECGDPINIITSIYGKKTAVNWPQSTKHRCQPDL